MTDLASTGMAIKPKADSTLHNMRKADLIEYIRCLENNYNTAVWFNENQARYVESLKLPTWISCEERLPDENQRVLCVMKDGQFKILTWTYIDWAWEDETVWWGEEDVTHWMPLPQPPKGDE